MKAQKYVLTGKLLIITQVITILLFAGVLTNCAPKTSEGNAAHNIHPYTKLCGYGRDRVNIMIYFYGSDLEDISHMASQDIKEIQNNTLSENVRVFIETNGVRNWDESVISASNKYVQRFLISNQGMELTDKNLGPIDLDVKENLEWFISQTAHKYPAERNILILWGHGDGSYFWKNDISLPNGITPEDIDEILERAGIKFEAIGFDACGMATISMIDVLSKHADYMIAASTDEPISGWNYNNWISTLSDDTSVDAVMYLTQLVQDYIFTVSTEESVFDLAVFDLSQAQKFITDINQDFILAYDAIPKEDNNPKGIPIGDVLLNIPKDASSDILDNIKRMTVVHQCNYLNTNFKYGINVTENDIDRIRGNKE